jgi:serine/threonine protein phosphatase 1
MARTYVIADIHGRLDLLEAALARIENHAPGKVVFTGDFIDGGPDSRGVVARLIAGPRGGWEWVVVRGNHEDMLLDCYLGKNLLWWLKHGGRETVDSYTGEIDPTHVEWMRSLPRLYSDKHRVYVHAGVDECYDLDQQPPGLTQWYRYRKGADVGYRGMHVVHGHTPLRKGPELLECRTNLDTNAFATGRLVVGVFHDERAGGPVELIEVIV